MKEQPDLHDTLVFTHLLLNPKSYIAMGSGTNMIAQGSKLRKDFNKEQCQAAGFTHWDKIMLCKITEREQKLPEEE
jgi:hypothetical protein